MHPVLASESALPLTIAIILILGVGGQWLANRLRIPGVLLLLTAGIAVGPILEVIDPVDDSDIDPDETVELAIVTDAAYVIGTPAAATVTITENSSIDGE